MRDGEHVGLEHALELRQIFVVLGLYAERNAGIGDDDVGAAGDGLERLRSGEQRVSVGDVDGVGQVRAGQRGDQFIEQRLAPRHQAERGAALRVLARQRGADAAGGTGEEDVHAGSGKSHGAAGSARSIVRAAGR